MSERVDRQKVNLDDFLGKVFLSHAYADAHWVEWIRSTHQYWHPVIFPPIQVPPDAHVSSELINAIRSCDTFFSLKTPASDKSPWVAFERDIAKRLGKSVFVFDPETIEIWPEPNQSPNKLQFHIIAPSCDADKVYNAVDFMVSERNFPDEILSEFLSSNASYSHPFFDGTSEIEIALAETAWRVLMAKAIHAMPETDGAVVLFWSSRIWEMPDQDQFYFRKRALSAWGLVRKLNLPDTRFLVIELDDGNVPEMFEANPHIRLFGDPSLSWTHYTDQLVVNLCWYSYLNH